jgi:uncharacterized protein (TIGR02001 family)
MKKSLLALAAALALPVLPTVAHADLAFNVGVVSDYRYRGISQSRLKPAVQGGVDWSHSSGFYLGAWASTIKWIKDAQGDASLEIDLYGGYKGEITKGVNFDVGLLTYQYPGAVTAGFSDFGLKNPNTTELYGAITFGPATLKYSHSTTTLFGLPDSKGSGYLDLTASFEVAGITIAPHIGHQKVSGIGSDVASYTDWSLTASKDFSGVLLSAAIVGTDADKEFYIPGPAANSTKFLGKTGLVLGLKYSF